MQRKEYSAGMVSDAFWFAEFRKVIQLHNEGLSFVQIKQKNLDENIFGALNSSRSKRIANRVILRAKSLPTAFFQMFTETDIASQKIINLVSIMHTDSLFFDFIYEVYREKLIIGLDSLEDLDIRVFFKNKQIQSEKVAGWREDTQRHLGSIYKLLLFEANLIDSTGNERKILKPILDKHLEDCLKHNGMQVYINALTGVR